MRVGQIRYCILSWFDFRFGAILFTELSKATEIHPKDFVCAFSSIRAHLEQNIQERDFLRKNTREIPGCIETEYA